MSHTEIYLKALRFYLNWFLLNFDKTEASLSDS